MPIIGIPNPFLNFYTNGLNIFYGKREFSVSVSCFFHCIFTFTTQSVNKTRKIFLILFGLNEGANRVNCLTYKGLFSLS